MQHLMWQGPVSRQSNDLPQLFRQALHACQVCIKSLLLSLGDCILVMQKNIPQSRTCVKGIIPLFCTRLNLFNDFGSFFCNSERDGRKKLPCVALLLNKDKKYNYLHIARPKHSTNPSLVESEPQPG
jgi:hypothetical protein